MIVASSSNPTFLSNAYVVARREGGAAIIVDTGAPIEPLVHAIDTHDLHPIGIVNTHEHADHTVHNVELQALYDIPLISVETLRDGEEVQFAADDAIDAPIVRALATPGHCQPHFAFVCDDELVFTGDVLFKNSVGGTMNGGADGFAELQRSIMDVLMQLDHTLVVYPGHTHATTLAAEWQHNPFVRLWRGIDQPADGIVEVAGRRAQLCLRARDYDGGSKCWVRFDDDSEAIVGGGMVRELAR